ncbi:MAG: regulatory protein RecX [Pseudoflavonifractor sp.]
MPRISKLAPSTKVKGRWLCYLDDETILRVSEREVVSFSLYAGMDLDPAMLEQLTAATRESALRERALSLISTRPYSRKELRDKLVAKDEPGEDSGPAAETVLDWLEHLGYLNDAEYAKTLVRHYSAKGYGQRKIQDELWKRGVPREYWAPAQETAPPAEDGIDAFLRRKLKGEIPDQKDLKRVSDALARRGYRWDEIKDGIQRYGAEIGEE